MNDTDAFLQSLQRGDGNGNANKYGDMDYYTSSGLNSNDPSPWSHNSVGAPLEQEIENNISITPESFHSYTSANGASQKVQVQASNTLQQQQQQQQQQNLLKESSFDFSDYNEQIHFGNVIPQQQQQQQQQQQHQAQRQEYAQQKSTPVQNGVFASPEDMVKSEFSPVMMNSNSNSSESSSVQNGSALDSYSNNEDYLAKDEFGMNLDFEDVGSNDNFSGLTTKTGKRRKEKTSHNIIEKKYRTSINDKIFQLRDIVPALRVAYKRYAGIPIVTQDSVDLDGLEPAKKLNKASILMKTIEYIKHLENKCTTYKLENQQLKSNIPTPESLRPHSGSLRASSLNQEQPIGNGRNGEEFSHINRNSDMSNDMGVGVEMDVSGNNDYASKFLMGGLALTMGATCFGDNGDMGSARALFAMPIFQFSPRNGFILSNTNGVIDFQSSVFALFKIGLLIATVFYFVNGLFNSSSLKDSKSINNDTISMIPIKDTVQFDSNKHLKETLKKTFVVNKLKYRFNSMERIESKMAKCFAMKLYSQNSKFLWSLVVKKFVEKKWNEIKTQVDRANIKSKGSLNSGLEWNMITNVVSSEKKFTLDNEILLEELSRDENELELKDFLSKINSYILSDTEELLMNNLLKTISNDDQATNMEDTLQKFHGDRLLNNKLLKSIPEDFAILDCLMVPSKRSCDKLSKIIKINHELNSENLLEEQLVLYCSVMRNLIKEGKIDQCNEWSKKMPIFNIVHIGHENKKQNISIISFTAIFLMLKSLSIILSQLDIETIFKVEKLFGELRIWLGCEEGDNIRFGTRSRLIDYCIRETENCGVLVRFDETTMRDLDDDESEFELEKMKGRNEDEEDEEEIYEDEDQDIQDVTE